MPNQPRYTRRRSLQIAAATAASLACSPSAIFAQKPPRRPRVAALFTELRFRSHAFNILENFFEPYYFRGELVDPGCDVVSFYADQFPKDDLARDVSKQWNISLYPKIDAAMCCGGRDLAVDAVLLIGEQGDYPYNELRQHLYPRKQFFDQAVAVMQRAGRYVPLFNDKHLSYRWDWAKEMYDTARKNGMPLLAGSSVPLAERQPMLELPAGAEIETALTVHGGGLEAYDFHGLEVLQSQVEARRGGETGVSRVELLVGEAAEKAANEGRWSRALLDAALAAETKAKFARETWNSAAAQKELDRVGPNKLKHVLLVTYRDGLQGVVAAVGGSLNRWNFACKLKGETEPRATAYFNGPWGNRCLFKALSHAIQHLFIHGKEPYPAERTLLTTGMVDAAMHSHHTKKPIDTPHLDVKYQPVDWQAMRENGASWRHITADVPQPKEFIPGDARLKSAR